MNRSDFGCDDLVVLHEDRHILVAVKPQNVPSQADDSGDPDMLTAVKEHIKKETGKDSVYCGLVHRLDRPTGGVMVFAKTSKAAERLCSAIKEGSFEKTYFCVTCGEPRERSANLTHYLKKNEAKNIVMVVPMLTEGAKKAELHYDVLEVKQGFSLVRVKLMTGRSHQIRVQMATIGCPLFGDRKYGADARTFGHNLALWAAELRFTHPVSKEKMNFIVYPPEDISPWKAFEMGSYLNVSAINSDPYAVRTHFSDGLPLK